MRRQQQVAASRAVAKARGGDQKKSIAVVIGVALLAAAVIGGVLWTNASKNATAGQTIPVATTSQATAAGVVESRQGVVVVAGKPGAKATIDIYADFLCPICGEFQKQYGTQIEQQINAGTLQVRYHMVPLLNTRSVPEGYSLASANAAFVLCYGVGMVLEALDGLQAYRPPVGVRIRSWRPSGRAQTRFTPNRSSA